MWICSNVQNSAILESDLKSKIKNECKLDQVTQNKSCLILELKGI